MMRWTLALAALCACYMPPPQEPETVRLETPFQPEQVAWATEAGSNRIEGTALLRTRGGEPRTCATLDVGLIPWSRHAGERMAHLYGSLKGGFNPIGELGRHPRWAKDEPAFYDSVRRAKCDAEGRFEFDELPDGEWFVEAVVTWEAPRVNFSGGPQGGTLMQRVKLEGGRTQKLVLTH